MIGDSFQHSSDMLQQDSDVLEHYVDSVPGGLPDYVLEHYVSAWRPS